MILFLVSAFGRQNKNMKIEYVGNIITYLEAHRNSKNCDSENKRSKEYLVELENLISHMTLDNLLTDL